MAQLRGSFSHQSGLAQRKRVGPITQRSEDRNLHPLDWLPFLFVCFVLFQFISFVFNPQNYRISCRVLQFVVSLRSEAESRKNNFSIPALSDTLSPLSIRIKMGSSKDIECFIKIDFPMRSENEVASWIELLRKTILQNLKTFDWWSLSFDRKAGFVWIMSQMSCGQLIRSWLVFSLSLSN
jgi:hypothetical protein